MPLANATQILVPALVGATLALLLCGILACWTRPRARNGLSPLPLEPSTATAAAIATSNRTEKAIDTPNQKKVVDVSFAPFVYKGGGGMQNPMNIPSRKGGVSVGVTPFEPKGAAGTERTMRRESVEMLSSMASRSSALFVVRSPSLLCDDAAAIRAQVRPLCIYVCVNTHTHARAHTHIFI